MAINVKTNPPLLRDLRQMGLLSADAVPALSGPFRLYTQAFKGGGSAVPIHLTYPMVPGGQVAALYIKTDGTAAHYFSNLAYPAKYTVSADGTAFLQTTWLGSNNEILFTYAY